MKKFIVQLLAVVALSVLGNAVVNTTGSHAFPTFLLGTAVAAGTLYAYAWLVSRTERRAVTELQREGAGRQVGIGATIGTILFALTIAAIAAAGDYHVAGLGSVGGALWFVGIMAVAAVGEELVFRGVLFRHVEQRFGTWIALIGTGLVFGGLHLVNPDATIWGALAIAVEAGGMLGAAYVATRSLWLPIALHFAWNFAEGGIFGTEVSGSGHHHGLLDATTSGSMLISGGQFGPEASIFALLVTAAATAGFLRLARRRGHLVPLRRSASLTAATLAR